MSAEIGPASLSVVAVQVLRPRRPLLLGEHAYTWLQYAPHEAGRHAVEIRNHRAVVLHENRLHRIKLRAEAEQREGPERLPATGNVHLVAVDVALCVHEGRLLEMRVREGEGPPPA